MLALLFVGVTSSAAASSDDDTGMWPDDQTVNKLDENRAADDDTGSDDDSAPTGAKLPITMDGGSGCSMGTADPAGSAIWILLVAGLSATVILDRKRRI